MPVNSPAGSPSRPPSRHSYRLCGLSPAASKPDLLCVPSLSPVVTEWLWQEASTVLSSARGSEHISVVRPRPLENGLAFPAL